MNFVTTIRTTPTRRAAAAALIAAATAVGLLAAGCGRESRTPAPAHRQVRAAVATAERLQVPVITSATGSVHGAARADISTRMMGWVRRVHVEEGQTVRAGAPLVTIDDGDLRAKRSQVEAGIAEATAVLANADKTAARFEQLYAEKAVSKQQLDDVLTGRDRARAGLAAAQAGRDEIADHLRYLDIVSPLAGLVVRKTVQAGDMASPGMTLVSVEQVDRMKIVARVGEKDVSSVAVGDSATVEVTSLPGATFRAVVTKVVPAADPGSRTFEIEAFVPNPDGRLKSGMFARVLLATGRRDAVLVPQAAVVTRGQLRGVYVIGADGAVALRWIRLGNPDGARIEVLSGLEGGETLAISPAEPLADGDRVVKE
ncbi:MAG: efflux RND transporter periplasmic adaptor subunit [Candidatus Krumholzibacteriia bacterium]